MKRRLRIVYLIRHGETTAEKDRVIGITDQPLSIRGKNQANQLACSYSQSAHLKIYSSGLSRAKQTAGILPGNSSIDVEHCDLINEMNFGDWENQSWDAIYHHDPDFFNHWAQNWLTIAPPNGENFNDVIERCRDWYNETIKSQECMIVAHGGSLRALLCIMLELPAECVFNFEIDHCHVSKININQGNARAAYLNNPFFA